MTSIWRSESKQGVRVCSESAIAMLGKLSHLWLTISNDQQSLNISPFRLYPPWMIIYLPKQQEACLYRGATGWKLELTSFHTFCAVLNKYKDQIDRRHWAAFSFSRIKPHRRRKVCPYTLLRSGHILEHSRFWLSGAIDIPIGSYGCQSSLNRCGEYCQCLRIDKFCRLVKKKPSFHDSQVSITKVGLFR